MKLLKVSYLRMYLIAGAVLFTFFVAVILYFNISYLNRKAIDDAANLAEASYKKDIQYRKWASIHGGVYVPVTKETPPNPNLNVPERDIVTPSGRRLTLMNPAYMTRQVYEFSEADQTIRGRIISLKPLRPENAPDAWEREALQKFEQGGNVERVVTEMNGEQVLRYIRPFMTERSCLKCHAQQGYKLGDVRGAISLTVPLSLVTSHEEPDAEADVLMLGSVWVLGMGALYVFGRMMKKEITRRGQDEERFRMVTELSTDYIFIIDRTGRLRQANNAFYRHIGRTPEEAKSMKVCDWNAELLESECQALVSELFKTPRIVETSHRSGDGSVANVEINAIPIQVDAQEFLYCSARDITRRKQDEEVVRRSEQLFRQIWEQSSEGMRLTNAEGIITKVNAAYCRIIGKSREELEGHPLSVVFMPERSAEIEEKHRENFAAHKLQQHSQKQVTLWNGEQRWLDVSNSYVLTEGGHLQLLGIFRDISEQVRQQERIDLQSTALNAAVNAIVITDTDGEILWANPSFESLTGFSVAEAVGKNPNELLKSGLHQQDFFEGMWNTITAGKPWQGELVNRRKDGSLYHEEQSITPVINEEGRITNFIGIKQDITERKSHDQKIQQSEENLRTYLDASPFGVFITDREGAFVDVNPATAVMLGYSRSEFLAMTVDTIVTEASMDSALRHFRTTMSLGRADDVVELKRKDGSTFWSRIAAVKLSDGRGIAFAEDITEKKRMQDMLQVQHRKLETLVSNLPGYIYRAKDGNDSSELLYVSDGVTRTTGYSADELKHAGVELFFQSISQRERDRNWQITKDAVAAHTDFEIEYSFRSKHGQQLWLWERGRGVYDDAGNYLYTEGYVVDITARKNAELRTREAETQLQALYDQSAVGMVLTGLDTRFIKVNRKFCEMMGYPEQELTTMSVKDITHPLDFTAHNEPMQQLMNNSIESFSLEKRYLRKDRSVLWGNISVSLIKNEKKEPAFLATIVEDITQRKSFEAAIQNLAVLSSDQNELNTFDVIAKNFAEALHADCTIIGILSEDGKNIQTIAVNYDGKKTANFSFAVGATPCELVMKDGYTYIRDNFPEIFPGRISHVHEGMKSYIGTVLTNEEGRSEGLLIAMARKPLDVVEQYRTIHSLFAERTVNELVRLEADTSLQKSEEEYRFLVEQSQDIVVRLDVKGIIRYCSPAISHVGGYDAAAVVGRSFKEFFVDPEEIKEGFQQMKKSVLNGTSSRYEFRFRTRSGGSLWVESVGRGVTYQDGTIELQTILRDISERKHTESALKESERRYRGIIESSMDGFWLYDASANILQVNDAYCTMSGYTRDELCSMTISDIEAIEDPEETEIHIRSVKERGRDKFESIHRAKNGTLFDVEINTVLLKESNVLVAFISDITERKTAELKLRESERRFRGILEDVSLLSVILNDQGMIEMVNDYLLTATGYVRNEIIGRSWFDQFVPEEFREELRSVYLRGLKNGDTPGPFEMNVVTKTGDLLFVRWTNITMYDSEKRIIGITSLGEDITEQRKVQNELQDREEQFRTLITSMQQGIALHEMIFNEDGTPADYRFIDVNPSFERITGLQRADLVGRTVMEVMPGTEQYWLEKYARVVTSGEPMLYENYAAELGKFFEVIAYRPKEKQFATIVTDVTERKLNEQKIQASERQYRLLAENATDVIWTMNLDGQFTYISPSVLQLRGFTPEEVMKQPMKEVICEGSIQPVVEGLKRFRSIQYTREGSTSNLTEIEQPCKNGTTVWTEVVTHGIFDEQGNIIEILGVSRDITARKRSEDLLKARLSLSEFATTHSVKELLRQILDVAEKITESSIGFFHFVEDDQKTISLQTWSTNTLLHMCRAEGDGRHYDIGMAGVWVDCLYARRPVVHNEFEQLTHRKGLPVGHAPIHRELLIPILRNEKVVGILGVGNKPYQYDQNDIEIANQLATMSWDILERRKAELDLLDHERALAGLSQAAVELLQMTERNTRTVMASALQKLGEGLDADRAYVFVNHSMGDDEPLFNLLYEWVREGITPAIDEPEMQELNIRLKFPSIWHALSTGKPYNRLIDLVPPEEQSLLTGQSIKSLLVVPISIDDELWGFLGVDAVRSARRWNADNESVLNVAAESIGIAEQRIHAVVKLSEREQLLKFALDASGDGLWTYTIPTNEVYFSDEVKQLAGYAGTFTEDNFQFWLDHIHPEDRQGAMDAMERHLRGEAPIFTHEHRFLCNNGEYRWMLDRGKVLKWDKDGMPYQIFGTYSDIHQRKAIEQQVRDLNEKLEQKVSERTQQLSESIQEMESFSYSISHDLRAPVRAIDSFTKILAEEEEKQLSAEGKRLLKTVRSNTARMGHMIDDLLQFSRASRAEIKKTVFDMHAVVVKVLEESVVSEHHRVFRTVVHPLPKAYGDPSLLRQVAVNLIGNAVKFTRNRSEAHIEIGGSEENGMTTYWVKDNGTGFNMQYADKLFGVFHRLHNQQEFEGTGVGLAIVHRILKKHTGVISVESTEGVGTTFTFTLPAEPGI